MGEGWRTYGNIAPRSQWSRSTGGEGQGGRASSANTGGGARRRTGKRRKAPESGSTADYVHKNNILREQLGHYKVKPSDFGDPIAAIRPSGAPPETRPRPDSGGTGLFDYLMRPTNAMAGGFIERYESGRTAPHQGGLAFARGFARGWHGKTDNTYVDVLKQGKVLNDKPIRQAMLGFALDVAAVPIPGGAGPSSFSKTVAAGGGIARGVQGTKLIAKLEPKSRIARTVLRGQGEGGLQVGLPMSQHAYSIRGLTGRNLNNVLTYATLGKVGSDTTSRVGAVAGKAAPVMSSTGQRALGAVNRSKPAKRVHFFRETAHDRGAVWRNIADAKLVPDSYLRGIVGRTEHEAGQTLTARLAAMKDTYRAATPLFNEFTQKRADETIGAYAKRQVAGHTNAALVGLDVSIQHVAPSFKYYTNPDRAMRVGLHGLEKDRFRVTRTGPRDSVVRAHEVGKLSVAGQESTMVKDYADMLELEQSAGVGVGEVNKYVATVRTTMGQVDQLKNLQGTSTQRSFGSIVHGIKRTDETNMAHIPEEFLVTEDPLTSYAIRLAAHKSVMADIKQETGMIALAKSRGQLAQVNRYTQGDAMGGRTTKYDPEATAIDPDTGKTIKVPKDSRTPADERDWIEVDVPQRRRKLGAKEALDARSGDIFKLQPLSGRQLIDAEKAHQKQVDVLRQEHQVKYAAPVLPQAPPATPKAPPATPQAPKAPAPQQPVKPWEARAARDKAENERVAETIGVATRGENLRPITADDLREADELGLPTDLQGRRSLVAPIRQSEDQASAGGRAITDDELEAMTPRELAAYVDNPYMWNKSKWDQSTYVSRGLRSDPAVETPSSFVDEVEAIALDARVQRARDLHRQRGEQATVPGAGPSQAPTPQPAPATSVLPKVPAKKAKIKGYDWKTHEDELLTTPKGQLPGDFRVAAPGSADEDEAFSLLEDWQKAFDNRDPYMAAPKAPQGNFKGRKQNESAVGVDDSGTTAARRKLMEGEDFIETKGGVVDARRGPAYSSIKPKTKEQSDEFLTRNFMEAVDAAKAGTGSAPTAADINELARRGIIDRNTLKLTQRGRAVALGPAEPVDVMPKLKAKAKTRAKAKAPAPVVTPAPTPPPPFVAPTFNPDPHRAARHELFKVIRGEGKLKAIEREWRHTDPKAINYNPGKGNLGPMKTVKIPDPGYRLRYHRGADDVAFLQNQRSGTLGVIPYRPIVGSKDLVVPHSVGELRKATTNSSFTDLGTAARILGSVPNTWRALATIYYPGYWIRNSMGNAMLMAQGGVNPFAARSMGKAIQQASGETKALTKLNPIKILRDRWADTQLKKVGLSLNGVANGSKKIMREAHESDLTRSGMIAQRNFQRTWRSEAKKEVSNNPLVKWQGGLEKRIEDRDKIGMYALMKTKGYSNLGARSHVDDTLFNYADITNFERTALKPFAGFYTWSRKALPNQLGHVMRNPEKGITGTVAKFSDSMTKYSGGLDEKDANRPTYYDKLLAFKLPLSWKDKKGDEYRGYFNFNFPQQELVKVPNVPKLVGGIFSGDWGKTVNAVTGLSAHVTEVGLSMAHPLYRLPIEVALNKSAFFGSPIDSQLGVDRSGIPSYAKANQAIASTVMRPWSRKVDGEWKTQRTAKYVAETSIPQLGSAAKFPGTVRVFGDSIKAGRLTKDFWSETASLSAVGSQAFGIKVLPFNVTEGMDQAARAENERLRRLLQLSRKEGRVPLKGNDSYRPPSRSLYR